MNELDLSPEDFAKYRRMKALESDLSFGSWLVSSSELMEFYDLKKHFRKITND